MHRLFQNERTVWLEFAAFRIPVHEERKKQLFPCKKEGKQCFRGTNSGVDGIHLYKRFQVQLLKISVSSAIKDTAVRYL